MVASNYRFEQDARSLTCPRCGKSTIVLHGDSTYVCLDHQCGFRHDVAETGEGNVIVSFFGALLGAIAIFALI
jgi:ribosomal protein S27AE